MKRHILLSRHDFNDAVFSRDKHKCVFCGKPAMDAHHILERRLWDDGGYYLDNGASVCEEHHWLCEQTVITVEDVREACGITAVVLPEHLYDDQIYDKWGNPILSNGQRLRGELFFDASVQKVLAQGGALDLFTHKVKYPRTHHLPWSQSINSDDRIIASLDAFHGRRVIVTEKMDGENTTLYSDYTHARSVDGRSDLSRDWVKNHWAKFAHDIPNQWRVCAENLYAKHSIGYEALPSFLMGFSVWNDRNVSLGWDETLEWFALLGIEPVPVLFDGIFCEKTIRGLWDEERWSTSEGYVVRVADQIHYADFRKSVAKFVRKNHIQTTKHWMYGQPLERNHLHGRTKGA